MTCNLYEREVSGTVPLFRLYHGPTGDHFYTASADERDGAVDAFGYTFEGITGFVYRTRCRAPFPCFASTTARRRPLLHDVAQERDGAINSFGYVDEGAPAASCCRRAVRLQSYPLPQAGRKRRSKANRSAVVRADGERQGAEMQGLVAASTLPRYSGAEVWRVSRTAG